MADDTAPREPAYPGYPAHSTEIAPSVSAQPRQRTLLLWLLATLIFLLVLPYLAQRISYSVALGQQEAALEGLKQLNVDFTLSGFGEASRLVAKAAGGSVVYISTRQSARSVASQDERQFYFGGPGQQEVTGQGSGVIIDADGHIITNFHVVQGAEEISVVLQNGETRRAEVIGADPPTDLALLKVSAGGLIPIVWGDSDDLQVGDPVWAIGSPFGLDNSITFGIVSAKARRGMNGSRYQSYIQTDAAVNPGNSGGALVNIQGELVGVNTAILGPRYQGISFAIPSRLVQEVYQRLKDHGEYARGWLGVQLEELTAERAEQLGVDEAAGVAVVRVLPQSPAQAAGLRAGDLLLEWDGKPVETPEELSLLIAATAPGSSVKTVIRRPDEAAPQTVTIRVGTLPVQLMR